MARSTKQAIVLWDGLVGPCGHSFPRYMRMKVQQADHRAASKHVPVWCPHCRAFVRISKFKIRKG